VRRYYTRIIVKKLNSFKHLVRSTLAEPQLKQQISKRRYSPAAKSKNILPCGEIMKLGTLIRKGPL